MSVGSAREFVERMKTDTDFAQEVIACKDSDARKALVEKAGYEFTPDELKSVLAEPENGELSDAQLEGVAGGGYDDVVECSFLPPCKEGFGDCKAH